VAPTDRRLRHFSGLRAPGKSDIKSRLPSVFFTRSCRSIDAHPLQSTTLLLLQDFDPFNQIDSPSTPFSINDRELLRVFGHFFGHFGKFDTSANSALRWLRLFGTLGFVPSRFLSTSHFKSLEAHFPKGLDPLPLVPFKINDSYSLRGLLLWRYTSRKFSLPNARESLIWTVLGIFVVERLKLPFAYASISKQSVKKAALCVHGYDLHDQGFEW
jgi:hypothetical protein